MFWKQPEKFCLGKTVILSLRKAHSRMMVVVKKKPKRKKGK